MVLGDPAHIATKLAKDSIVATRDLQLDDDVCPLCVNSENIHKTTSDGEFNTRNSLLLVKPQAVFDHLQILR